MLVKCKYYIEEDTIHNMFECQECGGHFCNRFWDFNYCPYCGNKLEYE